MASNSLIMDNSDANLVTAEVVRLIKEHPHKADVIWADVRLLMAMDKAFEVYSHQNIITTLASSHLLNVIATHGGIGHAESKHSPF